MALMSAASLGVAVAVEPRQQGKTARAEDEPRERGAIPDRVSLEQDSEFFFPDYTMLGVRLDGRESSSVIEFCVSEGWARIAQRDGGGRIKRERGRPVTTKLYYTVEPYWRDEPMPEPAVVDRALIVNPAVEVRAKPEMSREQARRLRQAARKAEKDAARGR